MTKKVALISGGTKGMGRGVVIQLLKDGFFVATCSRSKRNVENLQSELQKSFPRRSFLVLQADITKEADIKVLLSRVIRKFKVIDVLVNNAGFGYYAAADDFDRKKFQKMLNVNVVAQAHLTSSIIPLMKRRKRGSIVNIVSSIGKVVFPFGEYYGASKFAMMGYSEGIRKELKPYGIKVATVNPGMVKTDFWSEEELTRRKKLLKGKLPIMLSVEDVVRVVSLICNQSESSNIQEVNMAALKAGGKDIY